MIAWPPTQKNTFCYNMLSGRTHFSGIWRRPSRSTSPPRWASAS